MASALFDPGRELYAERWGSDDVRVMLVKSTYTFDASDRFLSDLGAVDNGRSASLGSKTFANGVMNAANTTLVATDAVACNALIQFVHTGTDSTARVLCYIDAAVGLPFTPAAGQTVNIAWDQGANKIFKL